MKNTKVTNTSVGKIIFSIMSLSMVFLFSNCSEESVSPTNDPTNLNMLIPKMLGTHP